MFDKKLHGAELTFAALRISKGSAQLAELRAAHAEVLLKLAQEESELLELLRKNAIRVRGVSGGTSSHLKGERGRGFGLDRQPGIDGGDGRPALHLPGWGWTLAFAGQRGLESMAPHVARGAVQELRESFLRM